MWRPLEKTNERVIYKLSFDIVVTHISLWFEPFFFQFECRNTTPQEHTKQSKTEKENINKQKLDFSVLNNNKYKLYNDISKYTVRKTVLQ